MNNSPSDAIAEFRSLCERAEAAYTRPDSHGDPDLLPFGQQILRLIAECPERQPDFEQAFRDLWHHRFIGPWELIPFCMHTLQWPSFRLFMEDIHRDAIKRQDFRCEPCARGVLESFHDDWDGGETFYAEVSPPGSA